MKGPVIGHRPTAEELAVARVLLEPWRLLTAPAFYGVEHVPTERPFLLVGNHTLMGVLDVPLMLLGLHERTGVVVRPLGDHVHFQIPLWRDLLVRFGTVEGTRENCEALMRAGESILVFPGGAREVFKHKGEQYHLIWKNRIGFAALAIAQGYPIVPVAAVGAEECYDILIDSDEMRHSALGPVLNRLTARVDEFPPVVAGLGPLPRPKRFYFRFAPPIDTRKWARRAHNQAACLELRAEVASAIERGIKSLQRQRRLDPEATLAARVIRRLVGEKSNPPPVQFPNHGRRRRSEARRKMGRNSRDCRR